MTRRIDLIREIQNRWPEILQASGVRNCTLPSAISILGSGTKTDKGLKFRYLTAVVYMAPSTSAFADGTKSMCPWATEGCSKTCLGEFSGRMVMSTSENARLWKTALYLGARQLFDALIDLEIRAFNSKAARKGYIAAIRIDGSTDTGHGARVARRHPAVQFYDYTKSHRRAKMAARGQFTTNYHVTFSYSGENWSDCADVLHHGGNVAAVFDTPRGDALPTRYTMSTVIDGDVTDLRFLDDDTVRQYGGKGLIVGLRFKAAAARSTGIETAGSFVIPTGFRDALALI